MDPLKIVFLISLPRSGSTLLQKILSAHPQVASTGEPWLLLPLAFLDQPDGIEAVYCHGTAAKGIRELIECLPGGRRSYIEHLRQFCLNIYQELSYGKPLFLDKTPGGYYLILDFLAEVFPDAKFIFLFRNPLDVMCSMMSTWLQDRLMLHAYHLDLYEGVRLMSRGCRTHADRSISVSYEQLVQAPTVQIRRVCDFLGIEYLDEMLLNYKHVDFGGSMGDPTGIHRYEGVSTASVNVWPRKLNNWYRIHFAREYLRALGDDVLAPWGISIERFEETARGMKVHFGGSLKDMGQRRMSDVWRLISGRHLRKVLRRRSMREIYLFH